jgi:hypothetical protein
MSLYEVRFRKPIASSLFSALFSSMLVLFSGSMAISAEGELVRDTIPFTIFAGPDASNSGGATPSCSPSASITDKVVQSTLGESTVKTDNAAEQKVSESAAKTEKTAASKLDDSIVKAESAAQPNLPESVSKANNADPIKSNIGAVGSSDTPAEAKSNTDVKDADISVVNNSSSDTANPAKEPTYKAEIKIDATVTVVPIKSPAQQIDEITSEALSKEANSEVSSTRKFLRKLGDMAQYATTCKGFHSSSEGADLILSEKEKDMLKNSTSLEYAKQRRYDGLHTQVAGCVFQIALGLGTNEAGHKEQFVNSGYLKLKDLIGEEKAQSWLNSLTAWSDQAKSENRKLDLDTLDVLTIQNKSAQVVSTALQNDDVVNTIKIKLHKYNTHSTFSRISNKVINTSLSLAALTPTFVSPAAQLTQFIYVASTGGPEESKLLRELYLDRRLEERFRRLSQETSLALTNYNIAVLTKNATLLGCCESVIKKMVGEQGAATILPSSMSRLAAAN